MVYMVYLPTFRCGCVGCQRHVAFSGCVNFKKKDIKLRIPWGDNHPSHKLGHRRLSLSLCFPLINGRYNCRVNSPHGHYRAPHVTPWKSLAAMMSVVEGRGDLPTPRSDDLDDHSFSEGRFNPKNPLPMTHPWGRTVYLPYQKTITCHENQPFM